MKLDAKFYGEIRKVKDDSVVPEEEYIVFLAKDNCFAAILPHYRRLCVEAHCDPEQIIALDLMILRVQAWRRAHSDRLKKPDAAGEKLLDCS